MREPSNGAAASDIDPNNPVFISCRQAMAQASPRNWPGYSGSQGFACGDRDDLPPGDTEARLRQTVAEARPNTTPDKPNRPEESD